MTGHIPRNVVKSNDIEKNIESGLSLLTRLAISSDYEPKVSSAREKLAGLLRISPDEVVLTPNFETTFAKLADLHSSSHQRLGSNNQKRGQKNRWQRSLPAFTLEYFKSLGQELSRINVGTDDLVQSAVLDAVSKKHFAFRIVDSLKGNGAMIIVG